MSWARLAVLALLLPLVVGVFPGAHAAPNPAAHYVPQPGDSLTFQETIAVADGYGNYSGYTEADTLLGTLNITSVLPNDTATATYWYRGNYTSTGTHYAWGDHGTFEFSGSTFDYVAGTDNQTGLNHSEVWFYANNSLAVGAGIAPLETPLTVQSLDASFALNTTAGGYVSTIYAYGGGEYVRDDSYGVFNATYAERSYFDPGTGYVVALSYVEQDSNGRGDGFSYTDTVAVLRTTFALTPASAPSTAPATFTESGLASGTSWSVVFDGLDYASSSSTLTVPGVASGTYLYSVSASGYHAATPVGFLTVGAGGGSATVSFSANATSSPSTSPWLVYAIVGAVLVVVIVVVVLALSRRSRRGPPLPRHSAGGMPSYGAPPAGPAPPPIRLAPGDQPQIQQVVVKEVVKVKCAYCGSLIDSTAEKCPFCGATRS